MDDKLFMLVIKMLAEMAETAESDGQRDGDPGKLGVAVGLGLAVAVLASVQDGDVEGAITAIEAPLIA
jgi:hypothetical protein